MNPASSSSTSPAFVWLMIAFLSVIALALVIVAFKDPAMLVVFGGIVAALCALALVAKIGAGPIVSAFLGNPIIALIVLVVVISLLLWLGRPVEKRLIIIGLMMFSVMLILFPQFVKRQVLIRLVDVGMGSEGYVVTGGILYAIATIMNAYLITE